MEAVPGGARPLSTVSAGSRNPSSTGGGRHSLEKGRQKRTRAMTRVPVIDDGEIRALVADACVCRGQQRARCATRGPCAAPRPDHSRSDDTLDGGRVCRGAGCRYTASTCDPELTSHHSATYGVRQIATPLPALELAPTRQSLDVDVLVQAVDDLLPAPTVKARVPALRILRCLIDLGKDLSQCQTDQSADSAASGSRGKHKASMRCRWAPGVNRNA
jgi:hypothetical protein